MRAVSAIVRLADFGSDACIAAIIGGNSAIPEAGYLLVQLDLGNVPGCLVQVLRQDSGFFICRNLPTHITSPYR